jgi:hypothetical protein
MDRLKNAIIAVMDNYIADHAHSESVRGLEYTKIIDPISQHYQLLLIGWRDKQRIFSLIFHASIVGDKIWIQDDNLEYSVAERLAEQGITKKEIVLAYFSTSHRRYTEYAVA